MNNRTVQIYDSPELVAEAFAEILAERIEDVSEYHIALSGGSTPKKLFQILATKYEDEIEWEKLHLYWGDERCVPPTHEESNYKMTKELLLDHVGILASNIYRIQGEADPETEAERYSKVIAENVPMVDDSPRFDMVMLGMGADGHTASIFPPDISYISSPKTCFVATHPESGQKRISITGTIINHAEEIAFLVTGEGKAERLRSIWESDPAESPYPAAHIYPVDGTLVWYVDQAAAALIPHS